MSNADDKWRLQNRSAEASGATGDLSPHESQHVDLFDKRQYITSMGAATGGDCATDRATRNPFELLSSSSSSSAQQQVVVPTTTTTTTTTRGISARQSHHQRTNANELQFKYSEFINSTSEQNNNNSNQQQQEQQLRHKNERPRRQLATADKRNDDDDDERETTARPRAAFWSFSSSSSSPAFVDINSILSRCRSIRRAASAACTGRQNFTRKQQFNNNNATSATSDHNQYQDTTNKTNHLIKQLSQMVRRNFFVLLFLLCCLLAASLFASLVISRSIGIVDHLQADGSDASEHSGAWFARIGHHTMDAYEMRTIELIDLIQCDKTFAYTKQRINVRVRKMEPVYKQQVAEQQTNSKLSTRDERTNSNNNNSNNLYHLTGTRAFVATTGTLGEDLAATKMGTSALPSHAMELDLDSKAAIEQDDPIHAALAALSLPVEASDSLNRTLIDCFLVDTDKRLKQRRQIERQYKQVTRTRFVSAPRMLAIIAECRQLTWSSFASGGDAHNSTTTRVAQHDVSPVGADIIKQTHDSSSSPALPYPLHEPIKPVEPTINLSPPVDSHVSSSAPDGALGALMNVLAAWSASGKEKQQDSDDKQLIGVSNSAAPSAAGQSINLSLLRAQDRQVRRDEDNSSVGVGGGDDDEARRASYLSMGMSMMSGIVPNTLWCGLGDRATNYSELGAEWQVDTCCRAHDHCPVRLRPFAADYGLVNWSMSTRSHCGCDLDFNNCLTRINSTLSNVIRTLYFRFIGLQCIEFDTPNANAEVETTTTGVEQISIAKNTPPADHRRELTNERVI